MAITTYSGLKTTVGTWLAREDLADYLPDFVSLAEGHLNARLRCRQMLETVTLSPVSGVYTLPADYLNYRRVVMDNGTRYVLKYITPDKADMTYATSSAGIPACFSIIGDELRVYPSVSASIELTYWQKIPALTDLAPSNWLLTSRPEVYLRLSCAFAADFIKNDAEAQKQMSIADAIIEQIQGADDLANYSRAGMTSQEVRP